MELGSLIRRVSRSVVSNRRLLATLLVAGLAMWALPSLAEDAAVGGNTPADDVAPAETDAGAVSWEAILKAAIVISVFVVPMILGSILAKRLRMPDYGWKFSLALGSLLAATVVIGMGEIKLGPDLSGGITLIYELQDAGRGDAEPAGDEAADDEAAQEEDADEAAADEDDEARQASEAFAGMNRDDMMAALIKALTERVDPAGTKEVSIKKFGDGQIEIIIPKAEKQELESIERRISSSGILEFRITASTQADRHRDIIKSAQDLAPGQNVLRLGGRPVARWVPYEQEKLGTPEVARSNGLVIRMAGTTPQALVMIDDQNVTGKYLRSSAPDVDEMGRPAVSFVFNSQGALLFRQLTSENQPRTDGGKYQLGILLDNRLLSAPELNAVISDRGIITGQFTEEEVNELVGILNAGSLPAALNKTPISRAQISPTLGKLTIERGRTALTISLILVAIFMLFYYKWAGFIAWFGLAANMLLILGAMVLIKAAFTLPGLAGLVLTVGMSVDANVLIYERIREELKRGAALRMAIRNGFNRASITILDSNVTNLITAAVIYKIAPDSVKGFGVTLFLGIVMSVFTAVFLMRLVFDVAERRGWLRRLAMREFVPETHIDFLSWRRVWITFSLVVIGVGLAATYMRGRDLLDIDFTGGSSITIVLKDDQKMTFAEVDQRIRENTDLGKANLSLVEVGNTNTRYTITTINDDVEAVENVLTKAFRDEVQTYNVEIEDVRALPGGSAPAVGSTDLLRFLPCGLAPAPTPFAYLTLLQAQPADEEAAPAETDAPPAEAAAPPAEQPTETVPSEPAGNAAAAPSQSPATGTESTAASGDAASATGEDDPFVGGTSARLKFGGGDEAEENLGVSHDTLAQLLRDELENAGHGDVAFQLINPEYTEGSIRSFPEWEVKIALPQAEAQPVLESLRASINAEPVFPLSNKIGGRVAGRMARDAIAAVILCLLGIIAYVWFRFHGLIYGIAAVVALIHDVLFTLGFVALSAYFVNAAGPVASALLVDKFQINLVLVAAFLTIIGYSLNDTIVIFDRIREIKGKSPRLTAEMINLAVNQTLARTILTSFTTLTSTIVLYIFGGEGIHAFAFALLVGFIAGCYSTIFIANPVLWWLAQKLEARAPQPAARAA